MATRKIKPRVYGSSKLTLQQEMFVQYLLEDPKFNAAEAARKAGYKSGGKSLLDNPHVSAAIGKAIKERIDKTKVNAELVLNALANIGFADVRKLFDEYGNLRDICDLDDQTASAVQSFEVNVVTDENGTATTTAKIKLCPKIPALELIATHLGMLTQQLNVNHSVSPALLAGLLSQIEGKPTKVISDDVIEGMVSAKRITQNS